MRLEMGRRLAKETPAEVDLVLPVPDSGVAAARGYAEGLGVPFEMGIVRNHYVGRTFIEPTQEIRDLKVKLKLSPVKHLIEAKRIAIIDDSLVRGTTSKQIVSMLKEAGAKEVHMRIAAPEIKYPCRYGIDTPTKVELISTKFTPEEIADKIDVDVRAFGVNNKMIKTARTGKQINSRVLRSKIIWYEYARRFERRIQRITMHQHVAFQLAGLARFGNGRIDMIHEKK